MRVFVAGASGAIGTRLVPQLIERRARGDRHLQVAPKAERVRGAGRGADRARPARPRAVSEAVARGAARRHRPPGDRAGGRELLRNFDRTFAQTNRLRTEGTDALLAAAREAGVGRFVAQSFASFRYAREGGPVKTEDDPLDPNPLVDDARDATPRCATSTRRSSTPAGSRCATAASTAPPTTGCSRPCASASSRSSARAAASPRSSTSTTPPRPPCSRSSTTASGHLQRRRRRARPGARVAAGAREVLGAKPPRHVPALARAAVRRRSRGLDGNGVPRRLEREGQARARLDAALSQLAGGLRGRLRLTPRRRRGRCPHGGHDRGRRPRRAHQLLVRGRHAVPRPELAGGAAHAFKVLERALAAARSRRPVRAPRDRHRDRLRRARGARRLREVTRAVTGDRFRVDPALARPERGRALEAFVFRLGYRDRSATLTVREGFVTDEFIDLARTEHRDADQERRLDALKREMADRVLAHPASEVYDATPMPARRHAATDGVPGIARGPPGRSLTRRRHHVLLEHKNAVVYGGGRFDRGRGLAGPGRRGRGSFSPAAPRHARGGRRGDPRRRRNGARPPRSTPWTSRRSTSTPTRWRRTPAASTSPST